MTTQPPAVEDERLLKRVQVQDVSTVPVRTIIAIEVGDLPANQVQNAVLQISQIYATGNHPTYILPVRNGKLTSDIIFEAGIEEMVRTLCEVVNGEIKLRSGWREVDVMRCFV
jgi:hypothetical protein